MRCRRRGFTDSGGGSSGIYGDRLVLSSQLRWYMNLSSVANSDDGEKTVIMIYRVAQQSSRGY